MEKKKKEGKKKKGSRRKRNKSKNEENYNTYKQYNNSRQLTIGCLHHIRTVFIVIVIVIVVKVGAAGDLLGLAGGVGFV